MVYYSVFTRSRMGYACSGDLSRFTKLVDLLSGLKIPLPSFFTPFSSWFSQWILYLWKNFYHSLLETWTDSEITPFSEVVSWDILLFLSCLWNVKFLYNPTYHFILPSLNWNPSMFQQSKIFIWHVAHVLVFQMIFLLELVGFYN